jgi:hypothetical protein
MPKREDPAVKEVFEALGAYYALRGNSGYEGLSAVPGTLRTAIAIRLDSAIQNAAPKGSVHRDVADSTRHTLSDEERIPKLVGALIALLPELSLQSSRGPPDDSARLYRVLKLSFPSAFAVLGAVRRRGQVRDSLASRQAIESCRNAMENLFNTLGGTSKWADRLDSLLEDKSLSKLARDVYAYLSTNGTHARDALNQDPADALLALRLTEAVMIRVLVKLGKW